MQKKYLHRHNPDALVRALQRKKQERGCTGTSGTTPLGRVSEFSFVGNYFTTTFLTTEVLSVTTFTRYTPVGSCISAFPKIFNPLL